MVLYRKYRPQNFSEVVGQSHVISTLQSSLLNGKFSHAYLFAGPRGTGKTSIARILAKSLNCEQSSDVKGNSFGDPCKKCNSCIAIAKGSHMDILEIDAASNRGIDEIRDLREKVKLLPTSSNFKVYIIDESHMLTNEAFNALLKTLEEPPERTVFILATTESHKIPATIASRCTRFDFKIPSPEDIKSKLNSIARAEKWKISDEALGELAELSAGAYRDGEVLLEKISSVDPHADIKKVREILGHHDSSEVLEFLKFIIKFQTKDALGWLRIYWKEGGSVRVLAETSLEILRKILLIKAGSSDLLENISLQDIKKLEIFSDQIDQKNVFDLIEKFNEAIINMRDSTIPQLPLEMLVVEFSLEKNKDKINVNVESNNVTQNKDIKHTDKVEITSKVPTISTDEEKKKSVSEVPSKKNQKSKSLGDDLTKLQQNWNEFLKLVKKENSSVEMFLKNARPCEIDDDLLTIEFNFSFHKSKIEEKKYRQVVEQALEQFLGRNLRIKGILNPKRSEIVNKVPDKIVEPAEEVDPVSIFGKLD